MLSGVSEIINHEELWKSHMAHPLRQLVAQRVFGICLGYEDLNDHEQLRYDPMIAALCSRVDVTGADREREEDRGKALAGKSTLQRFESAGSVIDPKSRYKKISYDENRGERFFVDHFLKCYHNGEQPQEIVLDLDATDDRLHGRQEGRFYHGFYNSPDSLRRQIRVEEVLCPRERAQQQ